MGIFSNWSWKAAANAVKEFIIALGRGDLVLRMRIDRAFPYILWTFFLGCLSIWKELRIENIQMTYELVQMDRMGKVEEILNKMESKVQPPQKPADKLKK